MPRPDDQPERLVIDYPTERRNRQPSELVPTVLALTFILGGMLLVTLAVLGILLGYTL